MTVVLFGICAIIACVGFYLILRDQRAIYASGILSVCSVIATYSARFSYEEGTALKLIRYVGSLYFGYVLYFSVCCVLICIITFIKPKFEYKKYLSFSVIVVTLLLIYGYVNALSPVVRKFNIAGDTNLKICFISDVHIGGLHTSKTLTNLHKVINEQHPDVVIFGGDVIDYPALNEYKNQVMHTMHSIRSKYGVYAILGNHECYCDLKQVAALFKECGITLLADTHHVINNKLCIVGRKDSKSGSKKPMNQVYPNTKLPVLVVDHNPKSIHESVKYSSFLHLSGHTHAGQMIPLNIIVNRIYKHQTGKLMKINNTYAYISSGYGFWSPAFRIGNSPEIVVINIKALNSTSSK